MLSSDAIIFGLGHLNGPRAKLSFGGDGAEMAITDRARAALNELISAGYAEAIDGDDTTQNREHYRGGDKDPGLGALMKAAGIDPFNVGAWVTFEKIDP